ncbi:ABC transporter ATP-binding protein [Devosia sp. CN2-171]|uniref:ABC transporter ATP-binding protein n=1 Tax=Devosia sp. CN2-171 TaxID=3400909 RepID=UPI003BF830DB
MLEVRDLSVDFSGKIAVLDTGFLVRSGESFGLVGESGSGKSTILRTVMGLNGSWSGTIKVDGLDVRKTPRKQLAKIVQMVFQDPYSSLHPRYVIGQQIAEPMRINGLPDPEKRTEELLDLVGLGGPKFQFRFPHELSGGQRQRVAIARALALSPKLLLLDEPTSALDVSIQAEILNLLNRLRKELGLTFVIVSHDLAVISYMCERLMVMRNARPVELLTREQLRSGAIADDYTRALIAAA